MKVIWLKIKQPINEINLLSSSVKRKLLLKRDVTPLHVRREAVELHDRKPLKTLAEYFPPSVPLLIPFVTLNAYQRFGFAC